MIGRAAQDVIDGGEGDDTFYVSPRNAISVTTGPGSDVIVIDESAGLDTNLLITV